MANLTKDERIIKDNPGLSPYELLSKGLSEKRYNEMISQEKTPVKKVEELKPEIQKIKPEIQPSKAVPKLAQVQTVYFSDQVGVKTPDGKITPMDLKAAQRFVRKNPSSKIV